MPESSEAVPAATIVMLRERHDRLETFMVVRHHQIDFASGALVFPGGKVDPNDNQVRDLCDGVADADDYEVAMRVAAIREAFEECGILLARPTGTDSLIAGEQLAPLEHYRKALNDGDLTIREFLEKENLRLACNELVMFAHWITPEGLPKRFDTYFYLAVAPEDHIAVHDGYESVDSIWITPQKALEGAQDGTYTIIFPTRVNVEMLATSATQQAVLEDAQQRQIVSVLPWMEKRDDGGYVCIPADAGYETVEEKMSGGAG